MNPFCNEAAIRKAADWRAFKRGQELVSAVAEATATENGWRGAVRDGRRPLRVTVIARSATDIEVRCPCPENQSSGAFCRHAVAVGLALAAGKSPAPPTTSAPPPAPDKPPTVAYRLEFPPPWQRLLTSGRLPLRIELAAEEIPSAADEQISNWLASRKIATPGMLQLDGESLGEFLIAAAGHPRCRSGESEIELAASALFPVTSVEQVGDCIVVTPEPITLCNIGSQSAMLSENRIALLSRPLPAELRPLAAGQAASLAMTAFLNGLDAFSEILAWPDEGWLSSIAFVAAKPEFEITFTATARCIEARPMVCYPGAPPTPTVIGALPGYPMLEGSRCLMRDRNAEAALLARLQSHGFQPSQSDPSRWQLSDETRVIDFIHEGLPALESRCTIHHGPGMAARMREVAVISPNLEILGSGEDWLEFNLSFETNDGKKSVDPQAVWQLLKTGGSGRKARISKQASDWVEPLFAELDLVQERGRFVASGPSIDCIRELRENLSKPNTKSELQSFEFAIPPTLNAELRPYQLIGAAWILNRLERYRGALLADDMGLGKTVQTIAVIERLFEKYDSNDKSVLVVATTSLLGNWHAELARFAPGRRVRILHGTKRDHEKQRVGTGEVWLTSYSTLARDLAWYLRRDFLAVVVDEASLMRNPDTEHAKALYKIQAKHRLALTGTPIENGVRDLWSIFRFIQPGWLGGRREFQERYEAAVAEGDSWLMRRLRIKISPFLLRRTKEEVARDLPAKIWIDEVCDLTRDQQTVYRELLTEGRRRVDALADSGNRGAARMQVLTALLRMRQACCDLALLGNERLNELPVARRSSKLERLFELLYSAISGGHKILVFSQFATQLREIHKCLVEREIDSLLLDGQTRDRQGLVDQFQTDAGPPVFLISLKAGGYGLNLTAADVVIHFDPWWNPAAEAQATDRAHRIGQTRPVTVYRLLTRDTVEQKVVALQRKKRALASAIDESGTADASGWNEQELAHLLE